MTLQELLDHAVFAVKNDISIPVKPYGGSYRCYLLIHNSRWGGYRIEGSDSLEESIRFFQEEKRCPAAYKHHPLALISARGIVLAQVKELS